MGLISVLIGVLVIVVVGAICFWAIDKFANDRRLANLLKLLVVLICLGAILQRVLPLTYYAASWCHGPASSMPRGRRLVTLQDAGNFITKLSKAEHDAAEWQAPMEAMFVVATLGGPTMFARIGVMQALNRNAAPEVARILRYPG